MIELISLALLAPVAAQGTVTVDVGRGPVAVYLPSNYDPNEPAPLIVALHSFAGNAAVIEGFFRFLPLQDTYGFIYCVPEGTVNPSGLRFWNATDFCCDVAGSGVDDSGYLRALIEEVEATVSVDPRSIHLIGHSNGGFMSHRMACDHADKVASIVSVSGATFADPSACSASEPVHVLEVHGADDPLIRYEGLQGPNGGYPGAVETAESWATIGGCDLAATQEPGALDIDALVPGSETGIARYDSGCAVGGTAELWTVEGGGHSPSLTSEARNAMLQYLLARPKPGIDSELACGPASMNSSGRAATISLLGSDVIVDNRLSLLAEDLPSHTLGYFLTSRTTGSSQPAGSQGTLCLDGTIGRFSASVLASGPKGRFELDVDLTELPGQSPSATMAGETWSFQAWFRDGNPQPTSNLTDARSVRLR